LIVAGNRFRLDVGEIDPVVVEEIDALLTRRTKASSFKPETVLLLFLKTFSAASNLSQPVTQGQPLALDLHLLRLDECVDILSLLPYLS
jgi:hypothetical protein